MVSNLNVSNIVSGLGYAMVSVSWLIGVYYNVIISHVMLYLFASIASIGSDLLPWVTCDNWWNTENCLQPVYLTEGGNATLNNTGILDNEIDTGKKPKINTNSNQFKSFSSTFGTSNVNNKQ